MNFVVAHETLGYLKLPYTGGEPILGHEFSIVSNPGNSTVLLKEQAEVFATVLNARESSEQWKAVTWERAYADWQRKNPN